MKLALGPTQYYWSRQSMMQFYEQACHWPVDIVYLGETVCTRRHEMRWQDWLDIAAMLEQAGKKVIFSTLTLLESIKDMKVMEQVVAQQGFEVEANDMGAVQRMSGRPFVAGPYLNIYSPPSLALFAELGASRWVAPLEMGRDALQAILAALTEPIQTEVFAYGRMPLAFSARCFSARQRNLPKDNCQYVCLDYPDGLLLETREGEPFLTINGIQTQSAKVYNLLTEIAQLQQVGVDVLRISPQSQHTDQIVQAFRDVLDGRRDGLQASLDIASLMPAASCNGYWYGQPGLDQCSPPACAA